MKRHVCPKRNQQSLRLPWRYPLLVLSRTSRRICLPETQAEGNVLGDMKSSSAEARISQ